MGRVEAVDCLDQADVRGLHEVVLGQPALAVTVRDGASDAHVEDDHLGAQGLLLGLVVGVVQLVEQPRGGDAAVRLGIGLGGTSGLLRERRRRC